MPTKERLIDKLRDELYARHGWTGDTAVKFMVPIILGIRHNEARAVAGGTDESEAMAWALLQLKDGGKRELDTTLTQVSGEYSDVGPLLRHALNDMITFVGKQPDGVIYDIFEYLGNNPDLLQSLREEDFIGTLFERSVSDAFRGDDGRFFTPRNVILIIREMMHLLLKKRDKSRPISSYTVCDPCCGSARFLIYWSELLLEEIKEVTPTIKRPMLFKELKRIAEKTLFGADIHPETAAYGCMNMALHGDGATNITDQDSLDHFGFFVDIPLLRKFAKDFSEKWEAYSKGPARRRADLAPLLDAIEAMAGVMPELATAEMLDLNQKKWLNLIKLIRHLLDVDRQYPTQWDSIRALQRRFKRRAVFETMLDDWGRRNSGITDGLDIIISNPPFGREQDLMMSDPYVLCQYRLATEVWVRDMNKGMAERVILKSLCGRQALHEYYIEFMKEHLSKTYVDESDEVPFEKLSLPMLKALVAGAGAQPDGRSKQDHVAALKAKRGRKHLVATDQVEVANLPATEVKRIAGRLLYEGSVPGEALAGEIIGHFGKEWLDAHDIEGEGGYSSRVTLTFGGAPHTIYYNDKQEPIVYKAQLPRQLLFVEQFLRMVKPGGLVFTVLDIGALNNTGDRYLREFLRQNAKVHAAVEMVHGAFKAAAANVRTVLLMYEKGKAGTKPYNLFLSMPQYLGYRLNDQNVPPIRENDLGKVLCDYSVHLKLGELYKHGPCPSGQVKSNAKPVCCWQEERQCRFWLDKVEKQEVDYPSERQAKQHEILSVTETSTRVVQEERLDPKFYVYEKRFEMLASHLSREGIQTKTIKQIALGPLHRGVLPQYDDHEGQVLVLKTVDVQNRKINWCDCRKVTQAFFDDNPRAQLLKDDIVLTSTGEGSWGRAAIVDIDAALADGHLTILRVNPQEILPHAAVAFLWSEYGRMQFEQRVRGSTGQTEIYPQDIEKIRVLIPPPADQQEIQRKIKEQFALLEEADALYQDAVQQVEKLLEGAGWRSSDSSTRPARRATSESSCGSTVASSRPSPRCRVRTSGPWSAGCSGVESCPTSGTTTAVS